MSKKEKTDEEKKIAKEKRRARRKNRKKRTEMKGKIPKEVIIVDIQSLYYPYKSWMDDFKKYWRNGEDTVFKICNSPWAMFVEDYVEQGDKILNNLNDHVISKWGWEAYSACGKNIDNIDVKRMGKDVQALRSAQRLIKIRNSIKEHGYCGGKYNAERRMINVVRGYTDPNGVVGYKLLWGNRRSAVCAGLGMKKIKVRCWEHY